MAYMFTCARQTRYIGQRGRSIKSLTYLGKFPHVIKMFY